MEAFFSVEGWCGITLGVDDTIDPDPCPEVLPEQLGYGRLVIWRGPIHSQAGGRNIFGIHHNHVMALVQPIQGTRERETRQQPKQRQDRAFPNRTPIRNPTSSRRSIPANSMRQRKTAFRTAICTIPLAVGDLCGGRMEHRTGVARRDVSNCEKMRDTRILPGGACSSMVRAGRS